MKLATLRALTLRNIKLFFKDPGMLFTSLITPLILLVLYTTFLGNVYRDAFLSLLPPDFSVDDTLAGGFVAGQLVSSLLAVSCVTVAFCSNLLSVNDKVSGARDDLTVSPVSPATLALSYYLSTALTTLIICYIALGAGFIYIGVSGWYLSAADVVLLLVDIFLTVMFGTALSSLIAHFLSTQGQISAVGTIVSSGYGFLCGAYMPISSFGEGLQAVLSFLPGTYSTSLLRNHTMRGVLAELEAAGLSSEAITGLRDGTDCNIYFFDHAVPTPWMFVIVGATVLLLIGLYITIHALHKKTCRNIPLTRRPLMHKEATSRTSLLLGEAATERLANARVALFGVGGVGGYVAEALARAGIGAIDLIDNDTVSLSNLNRQIIALHSTVGRLKVEVMAERIHDINPDCTVRTYPVFYLPETADAFDFSAYDYIADAVDTVSAKIDLALRAHTAGVPIIAAMGAGNKLDAAAFEVADLSKTTVCPLARVMRVELRRRGIHHMKVVYSKEEPLPPAESTLDVTAGKRSPGSVSYVPGTAGLILAGEIIKDLCKPN